MARRMNGTGAVDKTDKLTCETNIRVHGVQVQGEEGC
jgi:hypothetical protein